MRAINCCRNEGSCAFILYLINLHKRFSSNSVKGSVERRVSTINAKQLTRICKMI